MAKPADFDTFWDAVDADLARYPARPALEPLPRHSTDDFTVYALRLTSVGPYRIFGYFCVPNGSGPFPALLQTPRYGSVNHIPDYNDRLRYAVLQIMHRGQRLADQPFSAPYPGLLTMGIDDPNDYVYRGIVADCLRAAEFLLSRPEIDPGRVAIAGDDLALITAARRPGFSYAQYATPMLYRADEARRRTTAYPLEELNDYVRAHPEQEAAVASSLAFFDPLNHAARVEANTVVSVGDDGALDGLPWLQPLIDALAGPVEQYKLTHAGGTDHDRLDAWLAGKLGAEPMSRFRRVLA